ncbi:MAG: MGMT family protein [Nanoarchaeota archaeon]|nr:MGMT family protein [Nanoarchaeota archaeon]
MSTLFQEKIYSKLRMVPKGRVTTYKELAKAVGSKAYRAVGQAMNKNPYSPKVPCHRVVCSDGSIGGFATGVRKKILMLRKEGIKVKDGKVVVFESLLFKF